MCWFYAVDNRSRDPENPNIPTDPVFREVRAALAEIVESDQRTVPGLDGKLTRYMDFKMPIRAAEMLEALRHLHGNVCLIEDANRLAKFFAFNDTEVKLLIKFGGFKYGSRTDSDKGKNRSKTF